MDEPVFRIRRMQHYVVRAEMDIELTPSGALAVLPDYYKKYVTEDYDWQEDPEEILRDALHEIGKARIESGKGYKAVKLPWYDRPDEMLDHWDKNILLNADGTEGYEIGGEE